MKTLCMTLTLSVLALLPSTSWAGDFKDVVNSVEQSLRGLDRDRPGRPGRPEFVYRRLNANYFGVNVLPLGRLIDLDREQERMEIEHIMIRARSYNGRGSVTLLDRGRAISRSEDLAIREDDVYFPLSRRDNYLGRDLRDLELELRGQVTVDGVGVKLERRGGGGGGGYPPPPRQKHCWIYSEKTFQTYHGYGRSKDEAMADAYGKCGVYCQKYAHRTGCDDRN